MAQVKFSCACHESIYGGKILAPLIFNPRLGCRCVYEKYEHTKFPFLVHNISSKAAKT